MGFYISHSDPARNLAKMFADCIRYMGGGSVTTRSDHWDPNAPAGTRCLKSVASIQASKNFFALVDAGCDGKGGKFDAASPWLNFESGVAIGLGRKAVIFVHNHNLDHGALDFPLQAIFVLRIGIRIDCSARSQTWASTWKGRK